MRCYLGLSQYNSIFCNNMRYVSNLDHAALGNRLTVLINDMFLAEEYYHSEKFEVYWKKLRHSFHDLFENNYKEYDRADLIGDSDRLFFRRGYRCKDYKKELNGFVHLSSDNLSGVYSYHYKFDHTLCYTYDRTPVQLKERYLKQIRKLVVRKEIVNEVKRVSSLWRGDIVGVHIRLGDFKKHPDRVVRLEQFFRVMDMMKECNFFISTDEVSCIGELIKRYGRERIFYHDHPYDEKRDDYITAFIGILLLAKCKKLILTNYSTYSQLAWYFGECKATCNIVCNLKQLRLIRAIVLSCDRYHIYVYHMIKLYLKIWDSCPFIFCVPYNNRKPDWSNGEFRDRVYFFKCGSGFKETISALLKECDENEWVYWCSCDQYPIWFNSDIFEKVHKKVMDIKDESIFGITPQFLNKCGRKLIKNGGEKIGDLLKERMEWKSSKEITIWYHQYLRAKVLKHIFEAFDEPPVAKKLDYQLYKNEDKMYKFLSSGKYYGVFEKCSEYGEATSRGKTTINCYESFKRDGINLNDMLEVGNKKLIWK